jgi:hypothetical protein
MAVRIIPTLALMAEMYRLSRAGGSSSPRFQFYLAHVEKEWGLMAYNPMAGPVASEAVARLIELDSETLAAAAAAKVASACDWADDITLTVVVRTQGMWTDRVATEIEQRIAAVRRDNQGLIDMWSGEPIDGDDVRRESAAEAARVVWTTIHGQPRSLRGLLEREGLAYAVATLTTGAEPKFGRTVTTQESDVVQTALDLVGDSAKHSDIVGVFFGDGVSTAMGWTPLGVPDHAGYRWAIGRALHAIEEHGLRSVLQGSLIVSASDAAT